VCMHSVGVGVGNVRGLEGRMGKADNEIGHTWRPRQRHGRRDNDKSCRHDGRVARVASCPAVSPQTTTANDRHLVYTLYTVRCYA